MIRIAFLITNKFLEIDSTTLAGYDFSGMNLHRATLNGYCLDGAKFEKTHLRNVMIQHTSTRNAVFRNAALMNAILNNSDFTGSDCSNSRSIGENFKAIDNHGKDIINEKGLPNVCKIHDNV